jgi:hypothetical protein
MLAFLIIAAVFAISFGIGYGTRDLISRLRRRRVRQRDLFAGQYPQRDRQASDITHVQAESLGRVRGAATTKVTHELRPPGGQRVDQAEDFDDAVRDLLAEFGRRESHDSKLVDLRQRRARR